MRSILLLFLLVGLGTLSCTKMRPGFNTYDSSYSKAVTFDNDHSITLDGVVEDSRCPLGTQCVWAGQAVMAFSAVANNTDTVSFDLYFGDDVSGVRDTLIFEEYRIELLDVMPDRELGQELTDQDYLCRILVQKVRK